MSTNELILLGLIGFQAVVTLIYIRFKINAIKEILRHMNDTHESRYEITSERHWRFAREHYALLEHLGLRVAREAERMVVKKVTP